MVSVTLSNRKQRGSIMQRRSGNLFLVIALTIVTSLLVFMIYLEKAYQSTNFLLSDFQAEIFLVLMGVCTIIIVVFSSIGAKRTVLQEGSRREFILDGVKYFIFEIIVCIPFIIIMYLFGLDLTTTHIIAIIFFTTIILISISLRTKKARA